MLTSDAVAHEDWFPSSAVWKRLSATERPPSRPPRADAKLRMNSGRCRTVFSSSAMRDQGLGAAAVLLRLVQVAGQFEGDSNLRRQSAGAANIFVIDRPGLDAVEHSKHSEYIAVRTEQGNSEELTEY